MSEKGAGNDLAEAVGCVVGAAALLVAGGAAVGLAWRAFRYCAGF